MGSRGRSQYRFQNENPVTFAFTKENRQGNAKRITYGGSSVQTATLPNINPRQRLKQPHRRLLQRDRYDCAGIIAGYAQHITRVALPMAVASRNRL